MTIFEEWLYNCGYAPWDIDEWAKCDHINITSCYECVSSSPKGELSEIQKTVKCNDCGCPKDVIDKYNLTKGL